MKVETFSDYAQVGRWSDLLEKTIFYSPTRYV